MKKILTAVAVVAAIVVGFALSSAQADAKSSSLVLKKSNTIVLNDQVDDLSVAKVTAQAYALDAALPKSEPIYFILNTPGGSITAGLEMIANLNALGRKINTVTIFAASMGFQTVQGLNGERLVLSHGELMSHKAFASGGFSGEFGGKEPTQITSRYQYWVSKIRELDEQTVKRTNGKQTLASYQDAYENELWVSGQTAVNQGYADKVVAPRCDKSLSGTKDVPISFMGLEIILKMSECPLITGPLGYTVMVYTSFGTKVELNDFQKLGGQFGNNCSAGNITQLCAKDVTLTMEKIEALKKEAMSKVKIDRSDVIRGY